MSLLSWDNVILDLLDLIFPSYGKDFLCCSCEQGRKPSWHALPSVGFACVVLYI